MTQTLIIKGRKKQSIAESPERQPFFLVYSSQDKFICAYGS